MLENRNISFKYVIMAALMMVMIIMIIIIITITILIIVITIIRIIKQHYNTREKNPILHKNTLIPHTQTNITRARTQQGYPVQYTSRSGHPITGRRHYSRFYTERLKKKKKKKKKKFPAS